jgi:hypothetical protein
MNALRVRRAVAACRVLGVIALGAVLSAHVGSPEVFFSGSAGRWPVHVVVRPPQVVPGIASVTVKVPDSFDGRVLIRPVYWRAGSKGAPSADVTRQMGPGMFQGSLWFMASGAYTVHVTLEAGSDTASVQVPVASIATGRLTLEPAFGAVLALFGVFLVVGLVNIIRKGAGEGLLEPGKSMDAVDVRRTRIAGGLGLVMVVLVLNGGWRWWNAVDRNYAATLYKPKPLALSLTGGELRLKAGDNQYLPGGRVSRYVPDHGKLMHLFLVGDRAFAHLHPRADTAEIPAFATALPALPAGKYHVFGDVVQETGFERTLVGVLDVPDKMPAAARLDPDDGWFVGEAAPANSMRLADGSTMSLALGPATPTAGEVLTLGVSVTDAAGKAVALEEYLGMPAHAVVVRSDGAVFVHLHPMGTVSTAAQDVFRARDRGDTTAGGALKLDEHAAHAAMMAAAKSASSTSIAFPYAFPRAGDYRVFVQVRRSGRVLTGAFAVTVRDSAGLVAPLPDAKPEPVSGR